MSAIVNIGGVDRHLAAWKPARRKFLGVKPSIDVAALPMRHELQGFPLDYDQGQLGSCGPNSVAEVYEWWSGGWRGPEGTRTKFSRLFLYWFTRAIEGDFLDDTGVEIPDLMSVAHTMGMPLETLWPYELSKFQVPPPVEVLVDAVRHRMTAWDLVVDLEHMLDKIATGQPITFGFQVPASMQALGSDGVVNVPSDANPTIGGHCVNAIGFDRERELVKCTCHYGDQFGDHGAIWLPFKMFECGFASDMTAIQGVRG